MENGTNDNLLIVCQGASGIGPKAERIINLGAGFPDGRRRRADSRSKPHLFLRTFLRNKSFYAPEKSDIITRVIVFFTGTW